MKQILQNLRTGQTDLAVIPAPIAVKGHLLVQTEKTLISAGTERMLVEFGKSGWFTKARQHPDKVKMVLQKIKTDGILPTIETVFNKLNQPLPLGYCNVGRVIAIGAGVEGFSIGDRVATNGKHAEVVNVPKNLCAKIPESVSDEEAVFTVLSAIALQGIRLANLTLGENVVVLGLGLIGLLAVQLIKANGCRVLGMDFDKNRLDIAAGFGAEIVNLSEIENPVPIAEKFSRNKGVDAVIITASTASNEPVHQAAQMCRKRGRIILVGVTGLELSRDDFYKKELSFQVSSSYGPGRYDPQYEEKGYDYPIGFVRWTEQRNFEAVLDVMADRKLVLEPLITHNFSINEATEAYELIANPGASLGIVISYPGSNEEKLSSLTPLASSSGVQHKRSGKPQLGFIGSGNYASKVLIPAFGDTTAQLHTIASINGVNAVHNGKKFGFQQATTDPRVVCENPDIDCVIIATRHDSHAELIIKSLEAGKHVFVEKPLCISLEELENIENAYYRENAKRKVFLMIGFNRRFSPHAQRLRSLLRNTSAPKALIMTVNAGAIPVDHWIQDSEIGGGRIIGEGCHFIDLMRFLVGYPISEWNKTVMDTAAGDSVSMHLKFKDGSIATIHYLANGSKSVPKERLEIFCAGGMIQLENFRKMAGFTWPGFSRMNLWRQNKGQKECAKEFVESLITLDACPIPVEEIFEISRISIELAGA